MKFKLMIMKKTLKISLVIVVVLTALNVRAVNSELPLNLKTKADDGKKVSFTLEETKNVQMTIFDSNDDLVFRENISANDNKMRTYDLSHFPTGEYYLVTESDLKISKYKIEIIGNIAHLASEALYVIYKPVVVSKDGLVTVKLLNLDETPVSVTILDSNDIKVYGNTFKSEISFGKAFKMENVKNNKCTFIVAFGGKTFTSTIIL